MLGSARLRQKKHQSMLQAQRHFGCPPVPVTGEFAGIAGFAFGGGSCREAEPCSEISLAEMRLHALCVTLCSLRSRDSRP